MSDLGTNEFCWCGHKQCDHHIINHDCQWDKCNCGRYRGMMGDRMPEVEAYDHISVSPELATAIGLRASRRFRGTQ